MVIASLKPDLRALREIQAPQQIIEVDQARGIYRVSSAAFMPGSDKTVSVDLEESMVNARLGVQGRFPALPRAVALVSNTIASIHAKSLIVRHDPIPNNPHHGVIAEKDPPLSKRERREAARTLAAEAVFVVPFNLSDIQKYSKAQQATP